MDKVTRRIGVFLQHSYANKLSQDLMRVEDLEKSSRKAQYAPHLVSMQPHECLQLFNYRKRNNKKKKKKPQPQQQQQQQPQQQQQASVVAVAAAPSSPATATAVALRSVSPPLAAPPASPIDQQPPAEAASVRTWSSPPLYSSYFTFHNRTNQTHRGGLNEVRPTAPHLPTARR